MYIVMNQTLNDIYQFFTNLNASKIWIDQFKDLLTLYLEEIKDKKQTPIETSHQIEQLIEDLLVYGYNLPQKKRIELEKDYDFFDQYVVIEEEKNRKCLKILRKKYQRKSPYLLPLIHKLVDRFT
jgi:hypothetical protein